MKVETKRIARIAFLTAVALILSLVENAFPPILSFAPGVKLGLANVVCLIALIISGITDAYAILLARCLLASVFGGNISALMYSVPASLVSLTAMTLMYTLLVPKIGLVSVSVTGACVFNAVQLCVASAVVKTNLLSVLPLMLFTSIIAGAFTGLVAWCVVRYLPKNVYM